MLISFELLETIVVLYGPKKPFLLMFCLLFVSVRHNSYLSIQCFQQHDYRYHLRHIFIAFSTSNTSTNKQIKLISSSNTPATTVLMSVTNTTFYYIGISSARIAGHQVGPISVCLA